MKPSKYERYKDLLLELDRKRIELEEEILTMFPEFMNGFKVDITFHDIGIFNGNAKELFCAGNSLGWKYGFAGDDPTKTSHFWVSSPQYHRSRLSDTTIHVNMNKK